jgi:hypothetical protein
LPRRRSEQDAHRARLTRRGYQLPCETATSFASRYVIELRVFEEEPAHGIGVESGKVAQCPTYGFRNEELARM